MTFKSVLGHCLYLYVSNITFGIFFFFFRQCIDLLTIIMKLGFNLNNKLLGEEFCEAFIRAGGRGAGVQKVGTGGTA